jgi:hypothetical protein
MALLNGTHPPAVAQERGGFNLAKGQLNILLVVMILAAAIPIAVSYGFKLAKEEGRLETIERRLSGIETKSAQLEQRIDSEAREIKGKLEVIQGIVERKNPWGSVEISRAR